MEEEGIEQQGDSQLHRDEEDEEQSSQQSGKCWLGNLHRESRVDPKDYQAEIPEFPYQNEEQRKKACSIHKKRLQPYLSELQTYTYMNGLTNSEIKGFLQFARNVAFKDGQTENEGLLIGLPSVNQVEANALNFLAKCDYSLIKAKFYLVFPTLMHFNAYKSRASLPVSLSEEEMQFKIDQFISQLQETKLGQHEKWRQELSELLENKTPVAKIHQHLEIGKVLKYEIPDGVKEAFEKANKFSKELKKVMSERESIDVLTKLNKIAEEDHKIITNEIIQFQQNVARSIEWLERVEPQYLNTDKISMKTLTTLITEYKSLPLRCSKFEKQFKTVYDQTLELIEKIPHFSRVSKTRGNIGSTSHHITIEAALLLWSQIEKLNVDFEEFDAFESAIYLNLEKINSLYMCLNDEKQTWSFESLKQLRIEASELNFDSKVQDEIQDFYDYFKLIEKIKKQMQDPSKLQTLLEEITKGKERGFKSSEIDSLTSQIVNSIQWFDDLEKLEPKQKQKYLTEESIFSNFQFNPEKFVELSKLEEMQETAITLNIEEKSKKELETILHDLKVWREFWKQFINPSVLSQQIQEEPANDKPGNQSTQSKDIQSSKSLTDEVKQKETTEQQHSKKRSGRPPGPQGRAGGQNRQINNISSYESLQIKSFDDLRQFIERGLQFGVKTPELEESISYFQKGISWVINCLELIRIYENETLELDIISQEVLDHLKDISKNQQSFNYLNLNNSLKDYEKLDFLLKYQLIPPFCLSSKAFSVLTELKNGAQQLREEQQSIINLNLEEIQTLNHIGVVDEIPKLNEKTKSFPICDDLSSKLDNIFTLHKWGKEALSASIYIKEESIAHKNLAEQLKKQGVVEFAQQLEELTQRLPNEELSSLIEICKVFWINNDKIFNYLLESIQTYPLTGINSNEEASEADVQKWSQQKLKQLLQNSAAFSLKNDFLKLFNEIQQYVNQTDEWVESFYTKTIFHRIVITKDGKKITKKKGQDYDDLILSPIKEAKQNSQKDSEKQLREDDKGSEKIGSIKENGEIEGDDKIEEEEGLQEDQGKQLDRKRGKREVKQTKINTFNYYLSHPLILVTFFQGLVRNIRNTEMSLAQDKLLQILKFKQSAANSLLSKPPLDEVESLILIGQPFNCYIVELSVIKKLVKWAKQFVFLARKILDSIPKNKKILNLTTFLKKEVLPSDFTQEKYFVSFDSQTMRLSISPHIKIDAFNQISSPSPNQKIRSKKNDKSQESYLESQDNQVEGSNKTLQEQYTTNNMIVFQSDSAKPISLENPENLTEDNKQLATDSSLMLSSSKRNVQHKFIKSGSQFRPSRNKLTPKMFGGEEYLLPKGIQKVFSQTYPEPGTDIKEKTSPNGSAQKQSNPSKGITLTIKKKINSDKNSDNLFELKVSKVKSSLSNEETLSELKDQKNESSSANDSQVQRNLKRSQKIMEKKMKKREKMLKEITPQKEQQSEIDQQELKEESVIQKQRISLPEQEDEGKAYCICRGYSGEGSIGCDGCLDWFHFSCIGLKPQLGNVLKKFYCMGCCKRFNRTYLSGHKWEYIWDSTEKISLSQFYMIFTEGLSIPIQVKETNELVELKEKVEEQIQEMNTLTQRGPEILKIIELYEKAYQLNSEEGADVVEQQLYIEEEKDRQLFQCFLACKLIKQQYFILKMIFKNLLEFGFPVDFEQTSNLLLIIHRRDFARQLLRHFYSNKFEVLDMFFSNVQKLFDLPRILDEQGNHHELLLYNHIKKIFDKSVEVKESLEQLKEEKIDLSQYCAILQMIERQSLLIPNIEQYRSQLKKYDEWQHQAQNWLEYQVQDLTHSRIEELRTLIEIYHQNLLCRSPLIEDLTLALENIELANKQFAAKMNENENKYQGKGSMFFAEDIQNESLGQFIDNYHEHEEEKQQQQQQLICDNQENINENKEETNADNQLVYYNSNNKQQNLTQFKINNHGYNQNDDIKDISPFQEGEADHKVECKDQQMIIEKYQINHENQVNDGYLIDGTIRNGEEQRNGQEYDEEMLFQQHQHNTSPSCYLGEDFPAPL